MWVSTIKMIHRIFFSYDSYFFPIRFIDFSVDVFNSDDDYAYDQPEEIKWPFLPQNTAAALIGSQGRIRIHRRAKPGIIEECCHNACSAKELSQYCLKPPTTTWAIINVQSNTRYQNRWWWPLANVSFDLFSPLCIRVLCERHWCLYIYWIMYFYI